MVLARRRSVIRVGSQVHRTWLGVVILEVKLKKKGRKKRCNLCIQTILHLSLQRTIDSLCFHTLLSPPGSTTTPGIGFGAVAAEVGEEGSGSGVAFTGLSMPAECVSQLYAPLILPTFTTALKLGRESDSDRNNGARHRIRKSI